VDKRRDLFHTIRNLGAYSNVSASQSACSRHRVRATTCVEELGGAFPFDPSHHADWKQSTVLRDDVQSVLKCRCSSGNFGSFIDLPLLDKQETLVYSNCSCNALSSFTHRYLKETPNPGSLNHDLLDRIIVGLASKIKEAMSKQGDFSPAEFIESKKGKLRSRYMNAHKKNVQRGVSLKDISDIGAFVKNERYFEEKAPRMIMGRNPRFNLLYARFISPVEKAFFSLDQVANACDYSKCGKKFAELIGQWFFENDMSKYESSQRWFTLKLEYLVYALLFPDDLIELDALFAAKCAKFGRTTTGVKFDFNWCRGSGDMDTGLGNGILNYISTMYFQAINFCPLSSNCGLEKCSAVGCVSGKFVIKGDDSYGSMPVNGVFTNTYALFGFDAKLIVRQDPHDVEFCSGHFVRVKGGWYYVQKLRKLLTSIETVINSDFIDRGWVAHYYRSLGMMYKVLYKGLPVYEHLADYLMTVVDYGLNFNLVRDNSYGVSEAFEHFESSAEADVNTYHDISMVNDMSYAELDALIRTFKAQRLVLPF